MTPKKLHINQKLDYENTLCRFQVEVHTSKIVRKNSTYFYRTED